MKRLISLGSVALLVAACGDSPTQPLVEPDLLPTTSAALAEAPSIDIRKQADGADSRTFPSGSDVTFQIAVENTGNVPLAGVVVTDALTPDCNLDVSSVVFGGGPLPPGVTVFYACTASSVTAGFTNVACVEGVSPGTTTVSDCDPSTVVIEEAPSIDIRKQAEGADSRTFPSGSDVTFQIAVENTGDVPLAGVVVTDALTPDCNLDVSSVVFGGGPLPPGVTVFYACTASSVTAGFTNVACVEGVSPGTTTVSDCDPSTVVIEEVDSDGDGVPDPDDAFPNSDTRPTIVIDGRDTGVGNQQLDEPPGAFFADVIGQCAADAFTHTDFVDCVAHGVTSWRKAGLISGRDQGRIMRAAGMADIP